MISIKTSNCFLFATLCFFSILGCGGGGGGSSTTTPVVTVSSNVFVATADNKIAGGQKVFAFGQTADFEADGATGETWGSTNGSLGTTGQYFTPKDLSDITDDTISLTAVSGVNTRTISLSPFPSFDGTFFQYLNGNQKYGINNLTSTQAIGVATFQNNLLGGEEGNIKVKNLNSTIAKKDDEKNTKINSLGLTHKRCSDSNLNNYSAERVSSIIKNIKNNKKEKFHRATDALGTREDFYHNLNGTGGVKTFEKIYSGTKCLIYSEIENDVALVSQARAKVVGDAFEVANPFHPTKRPIFDVVTEVFGHPWGIDENGQKINGGGADGEEQVLFLFCKGTPGLFGLFYSIDEEPKGTINAGDGFVSNGAEIVYINQLIVDDDISVFSTIAHEFQHLCNYNQKFIIDGVGNSQIDFDTIDIGRLTMFNEGSSMLSEDLNGFKLEMPNNLGNEYLFEVINLYTKTISSQTPGFYTWNKDSDYGKAYLYWRFIYDTYGEEVVATINRSMKLNPEDIELVTEKKSDVLLQEFLLSLMQIDSTQPIDSKIKISTVSFAKEYFDTNGNSLGQLSVLNYLENFPKNQIKDEEAYVIRLYKILPQNNNVSFTLENIIEKSHFSIFPAIINK